MAEKIFYHITSPSFPTISLCDTANIKPPYIHFRRQAQEYILYYVHSGELLIREDDREYQLSDGDYILLDPSCEHEGLRPSTCCFTYIHFSLSGIHMDESCDESLDILFPKSGHIDAEDITDKYHQVLSELLSCVSDTPVGAYHMSSLLCELLALTAQNHSRMLAHDMASGSWTGNAILRLNHYLAVNYAQEISSLTLEDMFHCNFDHLNRCFKRATGDTIFSTLNHIRIENAKKYLATGLYTCGEISIKCGFHDVYYFSKVFKKLTGTSPAAYKKSCHSNP